MKEILFSIIIPIYNTEKYLPECLESILNQKFNNEKYEVILVNDGSTDQSLNIINKYIPKFKNFVLIDRENRGLLYSRMQAIEKSKGEYILFLDSDDYLTNNSLQLYYNEICKKKYDIIKGNYYLVNNEKKYDDGGSFQNVTVINKTSEIFEKLLITDRYNSVCAQVVKKSLINPLKIDNTIDMGEDVEINQNCYLKAKSIKIINDYVYCYRQNPKSMTHTISMNRLENNIKDVEKVYSRLIENVKRLKDERLNKLAYIKYLNKKFEFNYLLIKNCKDNKIINEIIENSLSSKYLIEAKDNLKYKDIIPRKKRIFTYMMLCNYKKLYINSLKLISKIKK